MIFEKLRSMRNDYLVTLNSVAVLDPAIATRNAGDEIISDSARREIRSVLPNHFLTTIPTHERLASRSYRLVQQSQYSILAGSNILTSDLFRDRGWRYAMRDTFFVNDIISLATGWRSYKEDRSPVGTFMLKKALSRTAVHSVRDEYTKKRLAAIGVGNVVNTGCVTMWRLDLEHLKSLPRRRAGKVVTTLNIGHPCAEDIAISELLLRTYDKVYVWPQGIDDLPYVAGIFGDRATILGPTLAAYDELLAGEPDLDFVGNRLHGGIRAMQHGHRALIMSVDNRATEITRDTRLPVIARTEPIDVIRRRIEEPEAIDIQLPNEAIARWRGQFNRRPVA
jgi:hypothetical protein